MTTKSSNKYSIFVFGDSDWYSLQAPRIVQGFRELGHAVVSDRIPVKDFEPDFIYCNDPGYYDAAIKYKAEHGGKLIFNVLDIPFHDKNWQDVVKNLNDKLPFADIITSISQTTRKDLLNQTGFDSEVIYNPIKDVFWSGERKVFDFLMCGRVSSSNKRFKLAYDAIKLYSPLSYINVCGSENPGLSNYLGVVNDYNLSLIYNMAKIYLSTSSAGGLELCPIEALCVGTPVVACNDCEVSVEFIPEEFLTYPNPNSICEKIMDILENYPKYQELAQKIGAEYKIKFDKSTIADRIVKQYERKK